ncbi:uncharacterized protein LOC143458643 isoform X3 [Clavelina lepadiformis]|uniref:uncharacterized protein LOC143458643 isoform X3 n=1 Tax=Clavelina lepadiformis TaxID=159417 RepID=UPI0040425CDA
MLIVNTCFVMLLVLRTAHANLWSKHGQWEYLVESKYVRSYDQADKDCRARQAHLAVIPSTFVQQFLIELIGIVSDEPYSFYIGLKRSIRSNAFEWTYNSSLPVTYTNWQTGEPNNIEENCVIMGWTFQYFRKYPWYNVPCSDIPARYVCQRRVGTEAFTTTSVPVPRSSIRQTTFAKSVKEKHSILTSSQHSKLSPTTYSTTENCPSVPISHQKLHVFSGATSFRDISTGFTNTAGNFTKKKYQKSTATMQIALICGGAVLVLLSVAVIASLFMHSKRRKDVSTTSNFTVESENEKFMRRSAI